MPIWPIIGLPNVFIFIMIHAKIMDRFFDLDKLFTAKYAVNIHRIHRIDMSQCNKGGLILS